MPKFWMPFATPVGWPASSPNRPPLPQSPVCARRSRRVGWRDAPAQSRWSPEMASRMCSPQKRPQASPTTSPPTARGWKKSLVGRASACQSERSSDTPGDSMPADSLLIRNIHTLVLMDAENQVLPGGYLYAENGEIRRVGSGAARLPKAGRVIDARHFIALPGLVNTHHHLYQTLTRAYAPAADAELFDWLRTLYPIWARLDEECAEVAALAGMAELLLSGCTTTSDHHYLFPRGRANLIDAQIAAARRIGMRFHPTRGSMSVGRRNGGLPPDSVVQGEERILQDCERLIARYHDPAPGSMLRLAL